MTTEKQLLLSVVGMFAGIGLGVVVLWMVDIVRRNK